MNSSLVPLGLTPEAKLERRRFIHRFEEMQRRAAEYELNVVVWRPTLHKEALVAKVSEQLVRDLKTAGHTAHLTSESAFERLPSLERAAYLVLLDDTEHSAAALHAVDTQSDLQVRMFVVLPRHLVPLPSADQPAEGNGAASYWTCEYDEQSFEAAELIKKVLHWLTVFRLSQALAFIKET